LELGAAVASWQVRFALWDGFAGGCGVRDPQPIAEMRLNDGCDFLDLVAASSHPRDHRSSEKRGRDAVFESRSL
jgi:hypothetical protein